MYYAMGAVPDALPWDIAAVLFTCVNWIDVRHMSLDLCRQHGKQQRHHVETWNWKSIHVCFRYSELSEENLLLLDAIAHNGYLVGAL
jgi:hypothetical protein